MSKFREMKFKTCGDEELNRFIQERLLSQGYSWQWGGKIVKYPEAYYLTTTRDGYLQFGESDGSYLTSNKEEIDISWLMNPRERVWINGKYYYKDEYDEAVANLQEVES